MLITRETDYAIRILRALADRQLHSMQPLCESEDIPLKFAYKILRKLRDGALVKSVSGKHGGCQLVKDLRDVSLLELIQCVDGPPYLNNCLKPGFKCSWVEKKCSACSFNRKLCSLQERVDHELAQLSLYDLLYDNLDLYCCPKTENAETNSSSDAHPSAPVL
jgi:Rrf2 family iron-responsive transcriptional regulator